MSESRSPFPAFAAGSAAVKARRAEDAWRRREPAAVAMACTPDSHWRNRAEVFAGHAVVAFLRRRGARELEYRLIKEVWAFHRDRIAVRFAYEWHDDSGAASGRTATRGGSSARRGRCGGTRRASTTSPSPKPTARSGGHRGRGRRGIRG